MNDQAVKPLPLDGRRQRSAKTRQSVIEAYVDLLRGNPKMPTVAEIARRAGCSPRSVFERFADRKALGLAAIDHVVSQGFSMPVGDIPQAARSARIRFQVEVRARNCETWLPLWRVLVRHQDAADIVKIRIEQIRSLTMARLQLMYAPELSVLSDTGRRNVLVALEALTDFESWGRLREHHGLSVEAATDVWIDTIDRLLPPTPARA